MCGRSYKAPKATPTPPAPADPNKGPGRLVFDNGSGRTVEEQLQDLSKILPLKPGAGFGAAFADPLSRSSGGPPLRGARAGEATVFGTVNGTTTRYGRDFAGQR